jgi:2-amino-4-hydroxy-6-hydroxymethyldihydropteridine diphosphokinase
VSGAAVRATIALGSNLGDRREHLESAVRALAAHGRVRVVAVSDWIATRPVGGPPGQGDYLNGAVEVETTLGARELLGVLLSIERDRGRDRSTGRNGPRTLDLDLILDGEAEIDEPGLVVPHPRSEERAFVLRPMAQVAPDRRFPRTGLTAIELLAELWP